VQNEVIERRFLNFYKNIISQNINTRAKPILNPEGGRG